MTSLQSRYDKWIKKMESERLAPRTIHFYVESMHAVAAILQRSGRPILPREISPEDVSFLLDYLAAENYAVQTRRGYLSALRRWCRDGGNRTLNRWPKPRFPSDMRPHVDWLSPEQARTLLDFNMTPLQTVVINLELREGLRHVEVIRLRISDIDRREHLLHVTGKGPIGGKPRIIPLIPSVEAAIDQWLQVREDMVARSKLRFPVRFSEPENLIIWEKGQRLHSYSEEGYGLDKVVTIPLSQSLGFHFSNHTLRRTFGRALFRAGVNIETISKILGHESTEVTLGYIGVDLDDMRSAMKTDFFRQEAMT